MLSIAENGDEVNKANHKIIAMEENIRKLKAEIIERKEKMQKLEIKRKRLEEFIKNQSDEFQSKQGDIEQKKKNLEAKLQNLKINNPDEMKVSNILKKHTNENKMLCFLTKQIEKKQKDLECPVCLELCQPPIYMCTMSHPVCSLCRPKLTSCPTCRTKYKQLLKDRRAEQSLEELFELMKQRDELSSNL